MNRPPPDRKSSRRRFRLPLSRGAALLAAGAAALALAGTGFGCRRSGREEVSYAFLDHLDEAMSFSKADRDATGSRRFVVGWEGRDTFFQHPDSNVQFRNVPLGPGAKLRFGVAMDKTCWDREGDGVQFEVVCRIGRSEMKLFGKRIDPKHDEKDRRWHDVEIDLGRFAGRVASFTFITRAGGRGDSRYDDAGWSDPVLVRRAEKRKKAAGGGTNVLLITADTLRADHLGCYGSPIVRTPRLDRLAGEGSLFENHSANANVTNPSHVTILSSLYAKDHDVHDNLTGVSPDVTLLPEILRESGFRTAAFVSVVHLNPPISGLGQGFDDFSSSPFIERSAAATNRAVFSWLERNASEPFFIWVHYFDPHAPYTPPGPYHELYQARVRGGPLDVGLAERFRSREEDILGLKKEIALLAEGRAGPETLEKWARLEGDDEFVALLMKSRPPPPLGRGATTHEAFAGWLGNNLRLLRDGKPADPSFGGWLGGLQGVIDAETVDDPNIIHHWLKGEEDFAGPLALYAGEVSYLDEHVGRLFDRLKEYGLYDRTLIVFTADHGESLGEHDNFFCHQALYEGVLHVPLIIKEASGRERRGRVPQLTNHVDIMPTTLDLLGLPVPQGARGESLAPLLDGRTRGFEERTIYAEHARKIAKSVRTRRFKYIKDLESRKLFSFLWERPAFLRGRRLLFDLSRDPGERRDLAAAASGLADRLDRDLERWLRDDARTVPSVKSRGNQTMIDVLRTLGYVH